MKHPHADAMDAFLRDMFSHGGPMRPTEIKREKKIFILNPKRKPCSALLAEQQRLIETWQSTE